jgi:hypothetical protein
MKNVLDKNCRENQNTFYVQELFPENSAVYKIIPENVVETEGP